VEQEFGESMRQKRVTPRTRAPDFKPACVRYRIRPA
jgi:hypothetical protein